MSLDVDIDDDIDDDDNDDDDDVLFFDDDDDDFQNRKMSFRDFLGVSLSQLDDLGPTFDDVIVVSLSSLNWNETLISSASAVVYCTKNVPLLSYQVLVLKSVGSL